MMRIDVLKSDNVVLEVPWLEQEGWETVGTFSTVEEKKKVYADADNIKGYLRVVNTETGNVVFGRRTALMPKPASDDCHTYS